jgi:hypothetical protein
MSFKYKLTRKADGKIEIIKSKKETKNKNSEINIFNLGTLVNFETHAWRASIRLPKEIAAKISTKKQEDWYKATKNLIDRTHLTDIYSHLTTAYNLVCSLSTPFPIKGIHFISADNVGLLNNGLIEINSKLISAVEEFSKNYQKYIKEAKEILEPDGLFNKADYPDNIKQLFSIHWRFFDISIPEQLSDELKEQEREQFNNIMEQTKNLGIHALRKSFQDIVSDLADTLTGKLDGEKKRMNQTKLDKISEFLDSFKRKNVFKDKDLENIIEEAKELVTGLNYKDIVKDKELTEALSEEMNRIGETLNGMVETYERKISF